MLSTETVWDPAPGEVLSVGELLSRTRSLLESTFSCVWVEGEVSNARVPGSGHAYFSLGDGGAQLKAVCFRSTLRVLGVLPRDGLHVLVRGRLTLYEARGDVQLVVEDLEPVGDGARRLEVEARKRMLAAEGLFDLARKRALPRSPRRIGVVTSATGAALKDILNVLGRRAPGVAVLVSPAPVQGREAPRAIVEALDFVAQQPEVDVVILGRGGGSSEDLSAFDDEEVVRAVGRCSVPVVSAVGHETDVPLVDFAADARAPTPSAAAELAVREWSGWAERLAQVSRELCSTFSARVSSLRRRLNDQEKRLRSPTVRLDRQRIAVDRSVERAVAAQRVRLAGARAGLVELEKRLVRETPEPRIAAARSSVHHWEERLHDASHRLLKTRRTALDGLVARLKSVSPRAVLERGYAIARTVDGRVLRDADGCSVGDAVEVTLARGQIDCRIRGIKLKDAVQNSWPDDGFLT